MSIRSNLQDSINSRIKFLDPVRFGSPYQLPILGVAMLFGLYVGKYIARYVRDHNPNQFAHSNRAIIRNAHRIYNYLFPAGSGRKYFLEVALPDNFASALLMEVHLHTMSYPIERPGSNIEETILAVMRIFFFIYSIDKVRYGIYKALRCIPHHISWGCAIGLAPTGVYPIRVPNGEIYEFNN